MLAPRLVAFMRRVFTLALAVKSRVCVGGAGRVAWRSHRVGAPSVRLALLGGRVNCASLVSFRKREAACGLTTRSTRTLLGGASRRPSSRRLAWIVRRLQCPVLATLCSSTFPTALLQRMLGPQ